MSYALAPIHVKRSRKTHLCWWCGQIINVGEPYSRWGFIGDYRMSTVKVHPECRDLWHEYSSEDEYYDSVRFGENKRPQLEYTI